MKSNFPCNSCGKCCKRVGYSRLTQFLDRGDSTCLYFDDKTNLCSIYHDRPIVCRVDAFYDRYLSKQYTWEEFVRLNIEICNKL